MTYDPILDEIRSKKAQLLQNVAELERMEAEYTGACGEATRAVPIAEAVAEPRSTQGWVIEDLLPAGGIGLIAAEGGVGKSTLLAQIAAEVALGVEVFGFRVPEPMPTLLLEAEGSRERFVDRIRVALTTLGIQLPGLQLFVQPRAFTPSLNGTTTETILSCKARLVVLDTIGLFHTGDENSATEFKANVIHPLRQLSERTGAAFFLVHHQSKPSELRKGRHSIRGTSAMVDDVDLALRLEAPDGPQAPARILHFEKIRHGQPREPLSLVYDFEHAVHRLVDSDVAAQERRDVEERRHRDRLSKIREEIASQLRKNPGGMRRSDLQEVVKARQADLRAALVEMERDGQVFFEPAQGRGGGQLWKLSKP